MRRLLSAIRHHLAHRLGWNEGTIGSGVDEDGQLYIWFECACGEISGVHVAPPSLV